MIFIGVLMKKYKEDYNKNYPPIVLGSTYDRALYDSAPDIIIKFPHPLTKPVIWHVNFYNVFSIPSPMVDEINLNLENFLIEETPYCPNCSSKLKESEHLLSRLRLIFLVKWRCPACNFNIVTRKSFYTIHTDVKLIFDGILKRKDIKAIIKQEIIKKLKNVDELPIFLDGSFLQKYIAK